MLINHKEEIRKEYGVIILGIFGSYARGEEDKLSDVDWNNLEKLLGCGIDLVRAKLLRDEIKEDILKEVIKI